MLSPPRLLSLWYPRRAPVGPTRSCDVWGRALLEGKSSPIIPSAHARALPLLSPSGTPAQNAHTPYSPECATYSRVAGVPTRRSRRLRRSRRAAEAKRKGGVQRIRTRPDTPVAHMFSRSCGFVQLHEILRKTRLKNFSSQLKKTKSFFFYSYRHMLLEFVRPLALAEGLHPVEQSQML
jgi:hypothetical protein